MNAAILLVINLHLHSVMLSHARPLQSKPTCSIAVVGFKFIGTPGQTFELAMKSYQIEKHGFIELISDGETTYSYEGRTLPLTVWPVNEFGMIEVHLPRPEE